MADPELSSQLSYAEVLKIYQDYADYDLGAVPNPARARVFVKAGRMLLALAIRRSGQAARHEEVELEPEILERQVQAAISWLATYNANAAGPRQLVPAPDWRDE